MVRSPDSEEVFAERKFSSAAVTKPSADWMRTILVR